MPNLWIELDFRLARKKPSLKSIQRYISYAKGKCVSLRLGHPGHNDYQALSYAIERCKELRLIRIDDEFHPRFARMIPDARALRVLILGGYCRLSLKQASTLIDQCQNLEQAEFHAITAPRTNNQTQWSLRRNIYTLVMKAFALTPWSFYPLIDAFPNVQRLVLRNFREDAKVDTLLDLSSLGNLEVVDLTGCHAPLPPKLPASVKEVNLNSSTKYSGSTILPPPELPCLKKLSLARCYDSGDPLMWLMKPGICNLHHLNFDGNHPLCTLERMAQCGFFSELRTLSLSGGNVDDRFAAIIAQTAPRLESLHLTHTRITGVGVKAIVLALEGTLQFLDLSLCQQTSKDAVEWARTKVKTVFYNFPDLTLRGRRLRQT